MKKLLLMRHAKSSWDDPALSDHQRLLNNRGKHDAARMAELLEEESVVPELILSSSAMRARTTAQLVAENCLFGGELALLDSLYHGDTEDYVEALQQISDAIETVMIVGHNPGMEFFLEHLTEEDESLPTAAVALVELAIDSWAELNESTNGALRAVWRPKEI